MHFLSGTRFVPNPFLGSTNWFLVLTNAFWNGYILACSSAYRSVAELNEMSDYETVPYLAKMTQHSSTVDWIKLQVKSSD